MVQMLAVLALALLCGVFGFYVVGNYAGFIFAIIVLAAWGVYHSIHLHRLTKWLDNRRQAMPEAIGSGGGQGGVWQGVFDKLSIEERSRTKRKQRLTDAIHRLNRMMAAIPSAVLIVNEKGGIEWKNARADEYLGLKPSKLSLKEQIDHEEFSLFLDKAIAQGGSVDDKLTLNQKTLLMNLIPIEANANMLIAHDISASEQLNISKNTFIANVSHELRTPLTVIQGFLETLADNDLDKPLQREFIGLMQKESSRTLDLIEGLLTLSRLENDQKSLEHAEPINLSELIEGICQDAKALSSSHHITSDIAPDVWVSGVYKELYSVFSNLVFNAIRHTDNGTDVHVHLSVGDEIEFFVQDNGEGIDAEHLGHLTERFYRVDKGRSRKTGGSGLGLAIAKHALARHQASLTIQSEVGVGSVFGVKMPKSESV